MIFLCIPIHSGLFGHRCVSVRLALVQLHFFQFDLLCNSPICALFPLESMF